MSSWMRRRVALLAAVAGLVGAPADAAASWGVDGLIGAGEALGPPDSGNWGDGQASSRLAIGVDVTRRLDGPWLVGAAASASLEWWAGGVGCGTIDSDDEVIAIGLACTLPTVGLHGLAGVETNLGRRTRVRLAGGPGVTAFFLAVGFSEAIDRTLAPSALVELQVLHRAGRELWLGVAVEGRVLTDEVRRTAATAAFVVAWR
jgi:hypothetical protein